MFNFKKIRRFFSFDRIVGYMTIAGSLVTIYGVERIDNLTVDLKPVIAIIQKQQNEKPKTIRDTVIMIHKDTIIYRDTVLLKPVVIQSSQNSATPSVQTEKDRVDKRESDFRVRHQLP